MSELIRFESRRVGTIEVEESAVVEFEALPGFPNKRRFVLMEHAVDTEMAWLVSLEDADLAFVVASPWTFFPQYDPPIAREHLAALGIEKRDDVELLCMVTLSGKQIFLNLAAPLVINAANRRGMQAVSDDPRYTTRAPIPSLDAVAGQSSEMQTSGLVSKIAASSPGA
jgi:flagellar assembly factor FliW